MLKQITGILTQRKLDKQLESGDILTKNRDFNNALAAYQSAQELDPANPAIHLKIGNTLMALGKPELAIDQFKQGLVHDAANYDLNYRLGCAHLKCRNPKKAIAAFDNALQSKTDAAECLSGKGTAFLEIKSFEKSCEFFEKALEIDPENVSYRFNLACTLIAKGDNITAKKQLRSLIAELEPRKKSNQLSIEDNKTLTHSYSFLGLVLSRLENRNFALKLTELALSIDSKNHKILQNASTVYFAFNQHEKALQFCNKALEVVPNHLPSIINKLTYLELLNRIDEAETFIQPYLSKFPANIDLKLLNMKILRRKKLFSRAEEYANLIETEHMLNLDDIKRSIFFNEKGNIKDALEKYDEAFFAFLESNKSQHRSYELIKQQNKTSYHALLDDCITQCEKGWNISSEKVSQQQTPIFFIGFPRSGTTLTGKILQSHSKVRVLEETNPVEKIIIERIPFFKDYTSFVNNLSGSDIEQLRNRYFELVYKTIERDDDALIIDKLPLYTTHLAFIKKLFPDARFIMAIRHPLDVILSNFTQLYTLNSTMIHFLSLEDTAKTYDKVMTLYNAYLSSLNPVVHEIRYEDVISDFEKQTENLLDFLGLDWEDQIRNYHLTSSQSDTITPSYSAVTERLYNKSINRWKNYEKHMPEQIRLLEKWVSKYGYSLT